MKKTTMRAWLFAAACCIGSGAYAQQLPKVFGNQAPKEHCATTQYEELLVKRDPSRPTTEEFEAWLAPKVAAIKNRRLQKSGQNTNEVVTIPVVFHIIHNGDAIGENENIADGQILSQITVLNQDFRKMAGTNGFNDNPVGADVEIEFCLAQRDPDGLYSTGIVRYNLGNEIGFDMSEVELLKAQTQWDPEKYLNIWVCNQIFGLAGYAQFPTNSGLDGLDAGSPTTADTDGVALVYTCVGSEEIYPEGEYDFTRNLGRTASHEVGHFLGLRHIWGDFGGCNGTDFCADTPPAFEANAGCPTGLDSCDDDDSDDMIENYMDYTDDACLNIFTADQKDRMQAVLENSPRRASLITSDGCVPGVVYDNDGALEIQGASGSEGCGTTFTPQIILANRGNNTLTAAVISYQLDDAPATTYNWTGSLVNQAQATIDLPVMELTPGEHEFSVFLVSVNGVADEAPANDTKSLELDVTNTYATTEIIITIQTDEYGEETLYALVDENDNTIITNASEPDWWNSDWLDSETLYTFPVTIEASGCYTFGIIDLSGDGICCDFGNGYYKIETADGTLIAEGGEFGQTEMVSFAIDATAGTGSFTFGDVALYPNPASSVLNLQLPDAQRMPEGYRIINSLGQEVGAGSIDGTLQSIDISRLSAGVYFIKLAKGSDAQTLKFIKQ